jgi:hypothetical protein
VDIRFAVAARADNLGATHSIWQEALPGRPAGRAGGGCSPAGTVTYGDYFQAVETYFQNEGACHLKSALAGGIPRPAPAKIDVILEKHGEFYHPARIRIDGPDGSRQFVLNVAVTPAGFECMHSEVDALRQVAPRMPEGAVPRIYGVGHVDRPKGLPFWMFLADWFENHHEFHLSVDPQDGRQKTVVWDTCQRPFFLTRNASVHIYEQAAYLLTRAYDSESTRQIYPWHHAAGDFVLHPGGDSLELKLVTVRQYAPTLAAESGQPLDAESRLMAALAFFANLTLRNRIDRLDGTGEMVWAGDEAVAATVAGFKRAADEPLLAMLTPLLPYYDEGGWIELLRAVAAKYRLMPAEGALFERHLVAHAACLPTAIWREFRI